MRTKRHLLILLILVLVFSLTAFAGATSACEYEGCDPHPTDDPTHPTEEPTHPTEEPTHPTEEPTHPPSETPPPPGTEGCTPGYWKNHLGSWAATGYSPSASFDTIFGVDLFNPDINLEQALNLGGGGVKRLARHGTAALLSAAHPAVDYPLSVAEVIAAVQAGDADSLEQANELGCPL